MSLRLYLKINYISDIVNYSSPRTENNCVLCICALKDNIKLNRKGTKVKYKY